MGKFPKSKKSKVDLSKNEELRNRVKDSGRLVSKCHKLVFKVDFLEKM